MKYTLHCLGFTVHCEPDLQLPLCFVLSIFSPLLLVKETTQTLDLSWFKRRRGGWAKIGCANWDWEQKDTQGFRDAEELPWGSHRASGGQSMIVGTSEEAAPGPWGSGWLCHSTAGPPDSRDCAHWTVESQKWPAYPENERSYRIFCWAWDPYNLHRDLGVLILGALPANLRHPGVRLNVTEQKKIK